MASRASSDAELAQSLSRKMSDEAQKREKDDLEMARQLHEQDTGTTATDFTCSMCFDEFKALTDLSKGVVTVCGHKYCIDCFMQYVETREKQISEQIEKARSASKVERDIKCPLCRESVLKDANRMRRLLSKPPVYIPDHPNPTPRSMTWDPATSVIVSCDKCGQRLYAPPGKVVRCVCKHIIKPQTTEDLWRKDGQVMQACTVPQAKRKITLVICPGCRRSFTAWESETVRCQCGTGLFVPSSQQQQEQRQRERNARAPA